MLFKYLMNKIFFIEIIVKYSIEECVKIVYQVSYKRLGTFYKIANTLQYWNGHRMEALF